jgi:hypothetical protein
LRMIQTKEKAEMYMRSLTFFVYHKPGGVVAISKNIPTRFTKIYRS